MNQRPTGVRPLEAGGKEDGLLPPLGAGRTPHRRWPRRAARSVLLAAMLLPLTVLSNGPATTAQAAPTSSARLEDQLDELNREADQLVEQYNQSKDALARTRRSLKDLRAQASGAEDDLRKLQAILGARASAAYVQGAGSAVAAVLGSDDPAAAIARVQVLDLLAAHDGDLMDQLGVAGKAYEERRATWSPPRRSRPPRSSAARPRRPRCWRPSTRPRPCWPGCAPPTAPPSPAARPARSRPRPRAAAAPQRNGRRGRGLRQGPGRQALLLRRVGPGLLRLLRADDDGLAAGRRLAPPLQRLPVQRRPAHLGQRAPAT